MGSFECNSIEDLVFNRSFREWVTSTHPNKNAFWTNWIAENPHKAELVNQSKAIIYALQINFKTLSEEQIDKEISRILEKLDNDVTTDFDEMHQPENKKGSILFNRYFQLSSLAAVLLVVFGLLFFYRSTTSQPATTKKNYDFFLVETQKQGLEEINAVDSIKVVDLPDGSRVYLEPQSKLNYARNFSGNNREIFLVGEAFFEVKRDPSRPFLVYTSSLITKVLGTSFRVKAYAADKNAIVTVKTGKVSVFKTENFDGEIVKNKKLGGIVVTPNQQLVYTSESRELTKRLTEKPEIVSKPADNAFVFDATPMQQVLRTLQDVYHIPVVYDEEVIAGCSLSAKMGNEPFYVKLSIICKAINASYEMIDGQIVIVTKGCK